MPDTDCLPAPRALRAAPAARRSRPPQRVNRRSRFALLLSLSLHAGLAAILALAALLEEEPAPVVEELRVSLQRPRPNQRPSPRPNSESRNGRPAARHRPEPDPVPDSIPSPLELRHEVSERPQVPAGGLQPHPPDPRFVLPTLGSSEPAVAAVSDPRPASQVAVAEHASDLQAASAAPTISSADGGGQTGGLVGPAQTGPAVQAAAAERALLAPINPDYPRRCRRLRCQGEVMVTLSIQTDGRIESVAISASSGCATLDAAAVAAARGARYEPAATATTSALCVAFRLR